MRINLLPWRDRKQQKILIWLLLIGALLTGINGICMMLWRNSLHQNIQLLSDKNNFLKIKLVSKNLTSYASILKSYNNLKSKIKAINKIKQQQAIVIKIINSINHAAVNSLYIKTLSKQNGQIAIQGAASSSKEIMQFINHLKNTKIFKNTHLKTLTKNTEQQNAFDLLTTIKPVTTNGLD